MPVPTRGSKNTQYEPICTPYVNSAMLPAYIGKSVRMVVRVQQLLGERAIVEACDGGQIEAALRTAPAIHMCDAYVELVVRVNSATNVSVLAEYNLGNDIDLKCWNKVVGYIHHEEFRGLFMP